MKTEIQVYCDYLKAIALARGLEHLSSVSKKVADDNLQSHIHSLGSCWEGESKEVYCNKMFTTCEYIKKSSDNLKKAAISVRQIAIRNYQAEMKAIDIAKKREY